ncbi:hypothetical protein CR513_47791, partial [Mucuna pruriens]
MRSLVGVIEKSLTERGERGDTRNLIARRDDWELKVDKVLSCFDLLDYEKVRMVIYEFITYALVWWNQFCREIKEGRRRLVDTWTDLKKELGSCFVPTWDLYNKLQRMYQRSKSVEDYHKDMEVALTKANRCLTLKKSYPSGPKSWRVKEKEKERIRKDRSPKNGSSIPHGQ